LVSLGLTARYLGPQGRGEVAAIITWVSLFSTVGGLSLGQVAIHRASARRGESWLQGTLGSLLCLAAAMTIAGWLIASGIYAASGGTFFSEVPLVPLVLGFMALPFYLWEQYGSSLLLAIDRVRLHNLYQVAGRTASLGFLAMILLWTRWGVLGAILATISGQCIVAAGSCISLLRATKLRVNVDPAETRALLKGGGQLHLNSIGTLMFGSANILMVSCYRGAEETAFYQLASQLVGTMLIVPQAASMVIYGKVSILGPDGAWPLNRKILTHTMVLVAVGAAVAWILAPLLIPWVAGSKFLASVGLFRLLLLSLIGMSLSTLMSAQWIGRGLFWQAALVTMLVGILNIGVGVVLIPKRGAEGAAYASMGSYALAVICNMFMIFFCNRRSVGIGDPADTIANYPTRTN
jgi:O-antigen/teichoic acid export membrane protein